MAPQGPGYESELKCRADPELNADSWLPSQQTNDVRDAKSANSKISRGSGRRQICPEYGAQNLKPIVLIRCEPVAGNPIFIFVLDFLLVFLFCRRALSIRIESES